MSPSRTSRSPAVPSPETKSSLSGASLSRTEKRVWNVYSSDLARRLSRAMAADSVYFSSDTTDADGSIVSSRARHESHIARCLITDASGRSAKSYCDSCKIWPPRLGLQHQPASCSFQVTVIFRRGSNKVYLPRQMHYNPENNGGKDNANLRATLPLIGSRPWSDVHLSWGNTRSPMPAHPAYAAELKALHLIIGRPHHGQARIDCYWPLVHM